MILPTVLALSLCCSTQEPMGGPATVSPATAEVPVAALAKVQAEVGPAVHELASVFGLREVQPFTVIVHRSGDDLPPALTALHHEGSPGFTLLARREIHLLLREVAQNNRGLRTVVLHELAHELLDQACGKHGGRIPRWFHEGIAQALAGDTYLGASEEMIVWRAATGQLMPFYELEERFPAGQLPLSIAYAQSYSFVTWLARAYGNDALVAMARAVDEHTTLDHAMVEATGKPTEALHEGWRQHLLHGSGAAWRSVLSEFFPLFFVLILPVLAVAMIRRLEADQAAREQLAQQERDEAIRAAAVAQEQGLVEQSPQN